MLAIAAASLMGLAAARTPCPDGRFVPAGQVCPLRDPFHLFFDWNSAEVKPEIEGLLFDAIGAYRTTPDARILLSGHTDRSGSADYNLRLSQRRAESIRRYLVSRGVPAAAIEIEAFGETRPIRETADGVREPMNSRVELFIDSRTD